MSRYTGNISAVGASVIDIRKADEAKAVFMATFYKANTKKYPSTRLSNAHISEVNEAKADLRSKNSKKNSIRTSRKLPPTPSVTY